MTEVTATPVEDNTQAAAQDEDPQKERGRLLRQAYGAATTRLRENHRDEFDSLYSQEAESLGVDYKPRPTAEQKAMQTMKELLEQFPGLRGQVALGEEVEQGDDTEGFEEDQAEREEPTRI